MSGAFLQFTNSSERWPAGLLFDREFVVTAADAREFARRVLAYADHAPTDEAVQRHNAEVLRRNEEPILPPVGIRKRRPCFVYVMHDKHTGLFKIGRSQNPQVRECTLQSEKPTIELLFAAPAAASVERELHEQFREKRVRGEWFRLDPLDVYEIEMKLAA